MVDDVVKAVKERDMVDDVALISLDYDVIDYAEQIYPEMETGVLIFGAVGDVTNLNCDMIIMEVEIRGRGDRQRRQGRQVEDGSELLREVVLSAAFIEKSSIAKLQNKFHVSAAEGKFKMTQDERLEYLVEEFKTDSVRYKDLATPSDTAGKRQLLRSLMNIRMPGEMPEEVLKIQDFPNRRAAKIAVHTVKEWLAAHPGKADRVIFNVFKDEDRSYYETELQ